MGCDWVAIRNLTTALGVFVGFATTSALFAAYWQRFAPAGPWKPIVTGASTGSAAVWCTPAVVLLAILMSTVSSFCKCTAAIPKCATACSLMTSFMTPLMVALAALMVMCIVATLDPEVMENYFFMGGLAGAAVVVMILMGIVAFYANQLVMCQ